MAKLSGSTARVLDKFYTKPGIAEDCLKFLHQTLLHHQILKSPVLWIEPSAGNGAFLSKLPQPCVGVDIAPEAPGIQQANFLEWLPPAAPVNRITVGNPPFGKNASLAVEFFNHAAKFSSVIALIVPRTFEKESVQRRLDSSFHLLSELALPLDSYTLESEEYEVPTVFQIWERRVYKRSTVARPRSHPDFEFTKRASADFAFQRVGANAGKIKLDFKDVADASHLFIRSLTISRSEMIDRFRTLDFSVVKHKTAGNPSISMGEIVQIYTQAFA